MSAEPLDADPGQAGAAPQEARPGARTILLRLGTVAGLVALDLWSKAAVFASMGPRPAWLVYDVHGHARWKLAGDWFAFMLSYNPGMAWGLQLVPTGVLVVGRCLAVLFLGWIVARLAAGRSLLNAALVLVLAGALGNLYDNLFTAARSEGARFGEVRDFIDVYIPFMDGTWMFPNGHFPTFNVADACISVGALLLLASCLRPGGEGGTAPA